MGHPTRGDRRFGLRRGRDPGARGVAAGSAGAALAADAHDTVGTMAAGLAEVTTLTIVADGSARWPTMVADGQDARIPTGSTGPAGTNRGRPDHPDRKGPPRHRSSWLCGRSGPGSTNESRAKLLRRSSGEDDSY